MATTYLFTGKLASLSRAAAHARVKSLGGTVATTARKDLGVLVVGGNGDPNGIKQRAVKKLVAAGARIQIMTEAEFLAIGVPKSIAKSAKSATPAKPAKPATSDGSASAPATPVLAVIGKPLDSWMPAFCGSTVANDTLYLVGGRGGNLMWTTTDGKKLVRVRSDGPGLRGITVDGKHLWVCGEYGYVGVSHDGGKKFARREARTSVCMMGIGRDDDGAIWAGGQAGYLVTSNDGKAFTYVEGVKGTIGIIANSPIGLLVPATDGLYVIRSSKPVRLGLAAGVRQAIFTSRGTLVAVGMKHQIHRSTNRGKTFVKAKVPPFAKNVVPKSQRREMAYWQKPTKDVLSIAELPDGRLVAGAEQGVLLWSADDGATWKRLEHTLSDSMFEVAATIGGAVILGGDHQLVLRVT